jgi:hypothetical protein
MLIILTATMSLKKINNIPTISYYSYKTPKWVYNKVYKKNMYPINSMYHPNNRKSKTIKTKAYISEKETQYNELIACNLPLGLIQKYN